MSSEKQIAIAVEEVGEVSGLWLAPPGATACYVFAHGAGAGMRHGFIDAVAAGLADWGIASLRYQFPYMEKGSRRPDSPKIAQAAVRAAVAEALRRAQDLPLIAGGKSFGGRMTSQTQADYPMLGVLGLAFFGFPLHPMGKPSGSRAAHLSDVKVPMLFLQGARDALADLEFLRPTVDRLGNAATLYLVDDADHSFHVPARFGRNDSEVLSELLDVFASWTAGVIAERC